jgi:hypothetical protein
MIQSFLGRNTTTGINCQKLLVRKELSVHCERSEIIPQANQFQPHANQEQTVQCSVKARLENLRSNPEEKSHQAKHPRLGFPKFCRRIESN